MEHQDVISPSGLQVCVAVCFLTCTPARTMFGVVYFTVCIAQDANHRITELVGLEGVSQMAAVVLPSQCSDPDHHSKKRFQGDQSADLSLLVPSG